MLHCLFHRKQNVVCKSVAFKSVSCSKMYCAQTRVKSVLVGFGAGPKHTRPHGHRPHGKALNQLKRAGASNKATRSHWQGQSNTVVSARLSPWWIHFFLPDGLLGLLGWFAGLLLGRLLGWLAALLWLLLLDLLQTTKILPRKTQGKLSEYQQTTKPQRKAPKHVLKNSKQKMC